MPKILKYILIFIACVAIGAFVMYKINAKPVPDQDNGSAITLYYRTDCPHCQKVEQFLNDNKVGEKVPYNLKEVGSNKKNADELLAKAKICNISTDDLGVPFLWDGEKCLTGDEDIIKYFQEKMANSQPSVSSDCQKLKDETKSGLVGLLEKANYCDSDSDCVDNSALFACPFGCVPILNNRNADLTAIKDMTNKYYDQCGNCTDNCQNAPLTSADLLCRNKKCRIIPEK